MSDIGQRQRHGVTKNLVEGIGGLIVGVAAVLLLRQWLRPAPAGPGRNQAPAPAGAAEPTPKPNRSTKPRTSQESNP